MRNFFNGNEKKKSKSIIATLMVMALVATYAMPLTVFAGTLPEKPAWDQYEGTPQTEISPDMTADVTEAQKQAALAEAAATAAAKAAADAAAELEKAGKAATDAGTIADTAEENATSGEAIHKEGAKFTDDAEAAITKDVTDAVGKIEGKVDVAEAAAVDAGKAAADADKALAAAKAATTYEAADLAAKAAADAAKIADTKAGEANQAYLDAETILANAKTAYNQAVADANKGVDGYNNQVGAYVDTVENLELVALKASFDAAAKAAKDAADAAAKAAADAGSAFGAATIAADAAMNFYVDPAKLAYEKSLLEKEKADQEKAAADKILADKKAVETEKQNVYEAVKPSITNTAKIAQDAEVAKLQQNVTQLQKEYDNLKWYQVDRLIEKAIQINAAKNKLDNAKSPATYNNKINAALVSAPEYKALTAAQADAVKAKSEADAKAQAAVKSQAEADARAAALAKATNTRDTYLANIIAAVGEADAALIVKALEATVDASENTVNDTEYDADLYSWATRVKDAYWYDIFELDAKNKEAKSTMGTINTEYTQKNFTDWLNKVFPWIHEVKDTDKIIAAAEVAYRAELKLHEEELATNEAYLAKLEADKAEEVAAAKMLAAKEANAKVAIEAEKLAKAEADLQAAKDRVAKLEKLKLDTEAAAAELGRALDLVGKAKAAAGAAQEAADAADADAKAAQDIANALKPAAPTNHRNNNIVAVITDPAAPLAEIPTVTAIEIEKEIIDQNVPMVALPVLPETSGTAPLLIYILGLLFVAGGIVLKRKVA